MYAKSEEERCLRNSVLTNGSATASVSTQRNTSYGRADKIMTEMAFILEWRSWSYIAAAIVGLAVVAWLSNWIIKKVLVRSLHRLLNAMPVGRGHALAEHRVVARLANVVPALVIALGITFIPDLPAPLVIVVRNVCNAFIILTVAMALGALLNVINALYQRRPDAADRPIKGYLEVLKIIIYAVAVLLVIAVLIDRSPLILLSGLGALAAVLMLIFQDTILSLVASIQISSNDMLRVGDWIEMPQLNADGFVTDIALHTVKVQNWDKTITTLPTKRLISEPFKNWRGMIETGGRRLKRSLYLDQTSIRFLTQEEREHLRHFELLEGYLEHKQKELEAWNAELAARSLAPVNSRRLTNIGVFRAYVERYLRRHPGIHQQLILLVRQLNPGPEGLPLEIYCFTNQTAWALHEGIQADIFDHLLAVLHEFGLRVYQQPSGADFQHWGGLPKVTAE